MADLKKLKENAVEQIWERLSDARFVMLGSTNPAHHMQPMTPQVADDRGEIWFYSDNTSELFEAASQTPGNVHMCLGDKDYQACISGRLSVGQDQEMVDRFWSPVVAAWFEGGKADPKLGMLRLQPVDAAIWATDANSVTFAWEMAKANIKDEKPDIGARESVEFGSSQSFDINR